MKDTDIIRICRCDNDSDRFCLTAGKYYVVQGEHTDLIDGDEYVWVMNDVKNSVNCRKTRFDSFENVSVRFFKKLNKDGGFR